MSGTMAPNAKPLLSMMGAGEAAIGLVLAVAPSLLVKLLLGAAPGTAAGVTVSRAAGVTILALGVACWLAREDGAGRAILVLAWTSRGLHGIALWPVVLAHVGLAVWCVVALSARNEEKRS
jgi:hypothetical protein